MMSAPGANCFKLQSCVLIPWTLQNVDFFGYFRHAKVSEKLLNNCAREKMVM